MDLSKPFKGLGRWAFQRRAKGQVKGLLKVFKRPSKSLLKAFKRHLKAGFLNGLLKAFSRSFTGV